MLQKKFKLHITEYAVDGMSYPLGTTRLIPFLRLTIELAIDGQQRIHTRFTEWFHTHVESVHKDFLYEIEQSLNFKEMGREMVVRGHL
jgi:hypothetical protein